MKSGSGGVEKILAVVACAGLAALAACTEADAPRSHGPAALLAAGPSAPDAGRYPLEIGNRWSYDRELVMWVRYDGGDEEDLSFSGTEVHEVVGTEVRFGREYMLVRETISDEFSEEPVVWWLRTRQDRAGLYDADISLQEPPLAAMAAGAPPRARATHRGAELEAAVISANPRVRYAVAQLFAKRARIAQAIRATGLAGPPGGPDPGELHRLSYPLRPGASWSVRETPFFMRWTVEGVEVREFAFGTRPAWRIRVESDIFGPDDRAWFWYGRDGLYGYTLHFETDATDPEGNVIGRLVGDESLAATAVDLARAR